MLSIEKLIHFKWIFKDVQLFAKGIFLGKGFLEE